MDAFTALYKKILKESVESDKRKPLYTISWQYSNEEGLWDDGEDNVYDLNDFGFDHSSYDTIEDLIKCEFPEDDGYTGGYHYVEVKDANGNVVFERGEVGSPI